MRSEAGGSSCEPSSETEAEEELKTDISSSSISLDETERQALTQL